MFFYFSRKLSLSFDPIRLFSVYLLNVYRKIIVIRRKCKSATSKQMTCWNGREGEGLLKRALNIIIVSVFVIRFKFVEALLDCRTCRKKNGKFELQISRDCARKYLTLKFQIQPSVLLLLLLFVFCSSLETHAYTFMFYPTVFALFLCQKKKKKSYYYPYRVQFVLPALKSML